MHATKNEILNHVLREYSRMANIFSSNRRWNEMSENELWQELCLCVLSSNVPYELAKSAFSHLMNMGYLRLEWITKTTNSQKLIASELSKPIYLPRKLNGSHRKYRFPNARSKNIYQAAKIVSSNEGGLSRLLANLDSGGLG